MVDNLPVCPVDFLCVEVDVDSGDLVAVGVAEGCGDCLIRYVE